MLKYLYGLTLIRPNSELFKQEDKKIPPGSPSRRTRSIREDSHAIINILLWSEGGGGDILSHQALSPLLSEKAIILLSVHSDQFILEKKLLFKYLCSKND